MQTKLEYALGDTGKNHLFVIKKILTPDGKIICYEIIDVLKKYSLQHKFIDEEGAHLLIKALNNSTEPHIQKN